MVFVSGLLSFFSPCILPLIPSYFGILAGVGLDNRESSSLDSRTRAVLLRTAAGFILGFSTVFIIMGLLLNSVFFLMSGISGIINAAAGIIVIIMGLNVIFDFVSFLNYERRPFLKMFKPAAQAETGKDFRRHPGRLGGTVTAFFGGAAFAAGWTPCIGPILTSVILLAGQSGKVLSAVFYLAVYSAGMGIPFFLCALFIKTFLRILNRPGSRLKSSLPLIRRIGGIILIIIGILILTGKYSVLSGYMQKLAGSYGIINP